MDGIDRSIAERASEQLSLITREQARSLGLTRRQLAHRLATGRLLARGDQVLQMAGAPPSFLGDVLAACLDTGGVASHRTAAALHHLGAYPLGRPTPVEVTVRHGRRTTRSSLATVHTTTKLPPDDVLNVGGVPVTSVARTLMGLASLVPSELSMDRFAAIVGTAVRDGKASDTWLWWSLERLRCRGRNGVSAFEAVLVDRAGLGRTESWLERTFLQVLVDGGLPLPVCQRRVRKRGAFAARVDFLYPADCLVVEVDGHGSHSTKEQRQADAERANHLVLAGYRVLRFTYDDVIGRPLFVRAMIRRGLAEAA